MSHSLLSLASATLLLGFGALAAVPNGEEEAPASGAGNSHVVRVEVSAKGGSPGALNGVFVQLKAPDPQPVMVGSEGAKLSLPTAKAVDIDVLFPRGHCSANLTPMATAGGRVTVVVDLSNGVDKVHCSIGSPVPAASVVASRPTP